MSRLMLGLVLSACLVLTEVVGCGATPASVIESPAAFIDDPAGRGIVTFDDVVASCNSGVLIYSRDNVAGLVDAYRNGREIGFPYEQNYWQGSAGSCHNVWGEEVTLEYTSCVICNHAAVNLAFGR